MKFLLLILAIITTLFSCRKELSYEDVNGERSRYYLKCKIDGIEREFNFSTLALTHGYGPEDSVLAITGFSSTSLEGQESLTLNIYYTDLTPFEGTYEEDYTGTEYSLLSGIYDADSTDIIYTAGYASTSDFPLQLIITERTETEISGTFEGAFYFTDIDDGEVHPQYLTFTNGIFRVKLKN
jgi:hypothetical protein